MSHLPLSGAKRPIATSGHKAYGVIISLTRGHIFVFFSISYEMIWRLKATAVTGCVCLVPAWRACRKAASRELAEVQLVELKLFSL